MKINKTSNVFFFNEQKKQRRVPKHTPFFQLFKILMQKWFSDRNCLLRPADHQPLNLILGEIKPTNQQTMFSKKKIKKKTKKCNYF